MAPAPSFAKPAARHYWVLGLVLLAFGAGAAKVASRRPAPRFRAAEMVPALPAVVSSGETVENPAALAAGRFVSHRKFVHTHASCLIELSDGKIRAFWYAGTDEGTADVTIQTAVFDPATGDWEPEQTVMSREGTQHALFRFVKKLGNPVAVRAADGSLQLYYVTVSVGGWAGSSITMIVSHDDGRTWGRPQRLITSPFLNQSTLVKAPPFVYADGTLGLPVHHEFLGKFGELLRLDESGAVLEKVRLSSGRFSLQPVVLIGDAERALVLMRYAGKTRPNRVISTSTRDAGLTWSESAKTPLANSNAALTGVVLPGGRLLVALNDQEDGRSVLKLVVSSDGGVNWKSLFTVEDKSAAEFQGLSDAHYSEAIDRLAQSTVGAVTERGAYSESVKKQMHSDHGWSFEFSYPGLIRTRSGDFHLVYTWNEAFIKHVQFSQAWLDRRLAEIK